jgi:4,5-DOPA dioxygenase extradiol
MTEDSMTEDSMTEPGPTLPPPTDGPMPALYLGHGAPPLVDDPVWPGELAAWAAGIPRPKAILVVSAHWEAAPLTLGATRPVPLFYDFYGFPERYYRVTYPAPGAPDLAARVKQLLVPYMTVAEDETRGLDHGAYVPLTVMWPAADVPVLQVSMPSLDPRALLQVGRRLAPLRDEGVLIMGSGFLTHGLPFLGEFFRPGAVGAPSWSTEFDRWADETLARGDLDALLDYRNRAPALRYAHPTVDHFVPLFVALGASMDRPAAVDTKVEGFWLGLSKRSWQFR